MLTNARFLSSEEQSSVRNHYYEIIFSKTYMEEDLHRCSWLGYFVSGLLWFSQGRKEQLLVVETVFQSQWIQKNLKPILNIYICIVVIIMVKNAKFKFFQFSLLNNIKIIDQMQLLRLAATK